MLQFSFLRRGGLMLVLAGVVLAVPHLALARDAWTTKTVTAWSDTTACPGTYTVNATWDKKGGPIASVDFHLYSWDADNQRWTFVTFVTGVAPAGRDSASYSFSGLATGNYTFTTFLWNAKSTTLGLFDGTSQVGTGDAC